MKTVKLDISPELAKRILGELEKDISTKGRQRDDLTSEITKLETDANTVREQLNIGNGATGKSPAGENKRRIIEFLRGAGDKGAKLIQVHRATGISISSASFTLKRSQEFVKEKKMWKLKT